MKNDIEIQRELKKMASCLSHLLSNEDGYVDTYYLDKPDTIDTVGDAYHFYVIFDNQSADCYDFNNHTEASYASNRLKKQLIDESCYSLPIVITFAKQSSFDELIKETDSLAHRCFYHGLKV